MHELNAIITYKYMVSFLITIFILQYLNVNLISFGVDHTLKFNWIHGKENFTNSVFGELS